MLHPGYDLKSYSSFYYTLYIYRNVYLKKIKYISLDYSYR